MSEQYRKHSAAYPCGTGIPGCSTDGRLAVDIVEAAYVLRLETRNEVIRRHSAARREARARQIASITLARAPWE